MTIATPLSLRWERAQQIDRSAIEPLGHGWYIVPSSRHPTGYAVHIELDSAGQLVAASCTCRDFAKRAPDLHGARAYKHIPAACLKAAAAFTRCTGCLQPACPRGILFKLVVYVLSVVFMESKCRKNGTTSRKYCASTCS